MKSDDIGERGQWMFALIITELHGRDAPFFRPRFLGDKYPTFDFLIELVDDPALFFFVQVKTTTQGFTLDPVRLRIQVSQTDIDRMSASPIPCYVVGIDETSRAGFLVSVNEPRRQISSLTTEFPINGNLLARLAEEVRHFWSTRDMMLRGSQFAESEGVHAE